MKLFDPIIIACDHTPEMFKTATALRGILEDFGLQVHFYHLIQKQQALDFFARQFPTCEYVVLFSHGGGNDANMSINLRVVDQVDGKLDATGGWKDVEFAITPNNVGHYVKNAQGTFISIACGSGRAIFGKAFLEAGYKSYIGPCPPSGSYYDGDAALVFLTTFFYHLMASDRDYATRTYSEREAVDRAAAVDADFEMGTKVFRFYTNDPE